MESLGHQIARKALESVDRGCRWPKLDFLFSDTGVDPEEDWNKTKIILKDTRERLWKIFDLASCPVSKTFYEGEKDEGGKLVRLPFTKKPPEGIEEAKKCVPGRDSGKIAGLYIPSGNKRKAKESDLILVVYYSRTKSNAYITQVRYDNYIFCATGQGILKTEDALNLMALMAQKGLADADLKLGAQALKMVEKTMRIVERQQQDAESLEDRMKKLEDKLRG